MRRDNRRKRLDEGLDTKKMLYITGSVLALAVIVFVITFLMYSKKLNETTEFSKLNTNSIGTIRAEETSNPYGKTVNEMEELNSEESSQNDENGSNSSDEENSSSVGSENSSSSSKGTSSSSGSSSTKVAINTSSSSESKTTVKADNNSSKNTGSTATSKNDKNTNSSNNSTNEQNNGDNNNEISNEISQNKTEKVPDPEFKMPVSGDIMKEFANSKLVYSSTLDVWTTHNGIDIQAEKTTVVKASADGTVSSIKNDPRYGLTITIEHVNGYKTVYANLLSTEFVVEGEKVKQGQSIGTIGNTSAFEVSDEPHLHFELIKNNEQQDPELYLN